MISVVVDIETIKKACENYESIYNHVNKLYRNKLEEYKNTKVKRKLFGVNIPWTQITLYKQSGVDLHFMSSDYTTRLARLKVLDIIRKEACKTDDEHWEFINIEDDIIGRTERYMLYYTLSELVKSEVQQIAIGYKEQRFINEYIDKHNMFSN